MRRIEFSDEEAQAWIDLMDVAVKQLGINCAAAAHLFMERVNTAEIFEPVTTATPNLADDDL